MRHSLKDSSNCQGNEINVPMESPGYAGGSPRILVNKITKRAGTKSERPQRAKEKNLPDRCLLFREDQDRYEIYERITSPLCDGLAPRGRFKVCVYSRYRLIQGEPEVKTKFYWQIN